MKTYVAAFCISLSLLPLSISAADVYEYENTIGTLSYSLFLSITPSGAGFKAILDTPREKFEAVIDYDRKMKAFHFIDDKQKIDLALERNGNTIEATGLFRGDKVKKTIQIDDAPWCQILELNFSGFINSTDTRFFYWVFVGYQNDMYKMEAEKLGVEKLAINGKDTKAVHILVKPVGFYSLLWHCDFWFSALDGSYLKYEAYEGIGVPLTITTFKKKTIAGTDNGKAQARAEDAHTSVQKAAQ